MVDFHAHWIPPVLADALRSRRIAPRIAWENGVERLFVYHGSRPFGPELHDLDARRELMQKCGIAVQLLSLPGLFGVDCLPIEESLPLATAFNDAAAAACHAAPGHFAAIAALPLADMAMACRELERAAAMGLRGAILPADGFVTRITAERFLPLFEAGDRLNSHFFIHPGPAAPPPEVDQRQAVADNAWLRHIGLPAQARLSEAVITMALSDFLDPFPRVTVQVANLGGSIPFLVERLDEVQRLGPARAAPPSTRLNRCYVDTASFGPRAIEMAVAAFGPERVVLGTDCPIFPAQQAVSSIARARLDAGIREQLLHGNAGRLIERLGVAV